MSSFWFKPRQVIVLDVQGGRRSLNFRLKFFAVALSLLVLAVLFFLLGVRYAPLDSAQDIIPENLMLKRQNEGMMQKLLDAKAHEDLQREQLGSLKEQLSMQESKLFTLSKELHHFKNILDERKGKGIQMLSSQADWVAGSAVAWQGLFVKGGSYPRFLVGSYKLFAMDENGHRLDLSAKKMAYRFESHVLLKQRFIWAEAWQPTKLELIVYSSRRKEVLREMMDIQGWQ